MQKAPQHIAVLTSGGDAPGMNAAIRAVVRACAYYKIKCTGIFHGFEGLMGKDFDVLGPRSVRNLINRGGTFLKSTRSDEFKTKEGREKAYKNLSEEGIDALIVIGGNGSLKGAQLLCQEHDFPVIGIPATIDNDINGTDQTIGYDTALNTVIDAIDKIRDTASSHNRLFLVEVMGRNAGDIAMNAGIGGGAEEILIPEKENMGRERLVSSLKQSQESGKTSSIVVVSEGKRTGKNIMSLVKYVTRHLSEYEVRATVLGHIQRGGAPSCYDRVLASRLGISAVETLLKKEANVMIGVMNKEMATATFEEALTHKSKVSQELLHVAEITKV